MDALRQIAKIGVDMEQFPDQKHLASWAGMCPGSNQSAGKNMVGRRGKKKTIIALGHKILIACYHIIKDKVDYKELGADHLDNFRTSPNISYMDLRYSAAA